MTSFEALIKIRTGLHFDVSMQMLLGKALEQRMQSRGITNSHQYYEALCVSHDEFDSLVSLLTINETYFFREATILDCIVDKCVPRLLSQRPGPVRILSAGCSSGEEAYSLAIQLHQKYRDGMAEYVQIHGCDIDKQVLDKARRAHYSSYSFRGVDPIVQQAYFTQVRNNYQLQDSIRQSVQFHCRNIVKEQIPEPFDIILLRNVAIYFDTATRRELHANLLSMLNPGGVVFFGMAETLANNFGILKINQEEGLFYFSHPEEKLVLTSPAAIAPVQDVIGIPVTPPVVQTPLPKVEQPAIMLQEAEACIADKHYIEAGECLRNVLQVDPDNREALLLQGVVSLEQSEFDQTVQNARKVLEQDEWSAEAKMLLGLALMWQHQSEQAIGWFRQVVYQFPGYWPAHYYLAELYRDSDLLQPARRTYRIALQLLNAEMGQQATSLLHLPLTFPGNSFRFLCERQLAKFDPQEG